MANMNNLTNTSPKTISNRDNKTFIPSKERDFVLKNWFCFVLRSILKMKIYQNYQWKASFNFTPQVFKLMMITNLRNCTYRLEQYFALHIWIIIFHIKSRRIGESYYIYKNSSSAQTYFKPISKCPHLLHKIRSQDRHPNSQCFIGSKINQSTWYPTEPIIMFNCNGPPQTHLSIVIEHYTSRKLITLQQHLQSTSILSILWQNFKCMSTEKK